MKIVVALIAAAALAPTAAAADPAPPAPTAFTVKVTGAGRPVIFIPGLGCPGSVWDATVAHYAGKLQAHVLTLAGFAGQAPPPADGPYLSRARDQVIDYIRANHLQRPIVVGHSLGGALALWIAETDPDIAAVVDVDEEPSVGALIGAKDPEQVRAFARQMHDEVALTPPAQFAAKVTDIFSGMFSRDDDRKRVIADVVKSDQATVARAIGELFELDLRPGLAKLPMPLFAIAAASDGSHTPAQIKAAWHAQIDAVPHVEFDLVPNTKHFVMLDQPAAFYAILDKALAK